MSRTCMNRLRYMALWTVIAAAGGAALAARAPIPTVSREPYLGAIVVNAADGEVLFEERADARGYPASVLKLMSLMVILDGVQQGRLRFDDPVRTTAEAARMGGSQVYLKEHEVFPLEDMLFALMVQSANDAATALAIHVAGSKDGFVQMMNDKARQLGLLSTRFASVHGLPPAEGQSPDITSARDLAVMCRALLKYPDALRFTSVKEHGFRNNEFIMRTHNSLLHRFPGCDGFKTGYFKAGGYSTAVTAERDGVRLIAVVLGSPTREGRDAQAAQLLSRGFAQWAGR
jgi:D-alanyl-D-alanine carboxypeptidase (penicillin-binding protein 5/6)